MALTQCMTNSFKKELPQAIHNFTTTTGHVFKIAMYTNVAAWDTTTTAYSATNEVGASGTYSAGGFAWTAAQNVTPLNTATTAYWGWSANPAWTSATITARSAIIYNSSASNKSVAVLDFGADKTSTAGTFTITLPTLDATTGILRLL